MVRRRRKRLKDLYVVELWSDEMRDSPFHEGGSHEVNVIHIASSLRKAKDFCHSHSDYGGTDLHEGYYPWHFKVRHQKLDEDQCCIVHNHSHVLYEYRPTQIDGPG
jgi:hypothetical protein